MMPIGKRKSVTMHLAAAVLFTCYLAQTIDCSRLKKTQRREGPKEADSAKAIGVQEGKILFGSFFESGASLESQVTDWTKKSSKSSVEDEAAYQADSAGWSKGETQNVPASPKEAAWKRMAPSLQCAGDQLKFRAVGPGASQFAVEQGNASPMPLSQVPSTCGYSMQRNSLALVMLVPYDGCNIIQEGGSYVLPMRWQGIPVSLWCPKPAAPTPAAPKDPVPQMHQNPGYFPPVTTAAPTTTTKMTTAATKPKQPELPQYPQYPIYFYPPAVLPPVTTAPPTTTTKMTTADTKPKQPQFPQYPQYPIYFPPAVLPPVTTAAPTTTTKMTTAATKPKQPELPQYPQYPIYFYPPAVLPPVTTAPPTTTTKMTTADTKPKQPQYPQYPIYFPPAVLPPVTTAAPTTTTKMTTADTKPKQPQFPQYPQYPIYFYPPGMLPPVTTAKPAAPFPPMLNPYPHFPWQFPAPLPPFSKPTTTQSLQSMPPYPLPYPLPYPSFPLSVK